MKRRRARTRTATTRTPYRHHGRGRRRDFNVEGSSRRTPSAVTSWGYGPFTLDRASEPARHRRFRCQSGGSTLPFLVPCQDGGSSPPGRRLYSSLSAQVRHQTPFSGACSGGRKEGSPPPNARHYGCRLPQSLRRPPMRSSTGARRDLRDARVAAAMVLSRSPTAKTAEVFERWAKHPPTQRASGNALELRR